MNIAGKRGNGLREQQLENIVKYGISFNNMQQANAARKAISSRSVSFILYIRYTYIHKQD